MRASIASLLRGLASRIEPQPKLSINDLHGELARLRLSVELVRSDVRTLSRALNSSSPPAEVSS